MTRISPLQIVPPPFRATWNEDNKSLQQEPIYRARQIGQKVAAFFRKLGIPQVLPSPPSSMKNLIKYSILPATHALPEDKAAVKDTFDEFWGRTVTHELVQKLNQEHPGIGTKYKTIRDNFVAETVEIVTPDGVTLKAILVRPKEKKADSTIIRFSGSKDLAFENAGSKSAHLLLESLDRKEPANFVFFDYRGVGDSSGTFKTTRNLFIDGSSVVQWVEKGLGTSPRNIHFFGSGSIGTIAAISTQALNPAKFTGRQLVQRSAPSLFGRIRDCFIRFSRRLYGHHVDVAPALSKLESRTLVLYNKRGNNADHLVQQAAEFLFRGKKQQG